MAQLSDQERRNFRGDCLTTHIKGDSYYEDPAIKSADPMERKTVLEDW